MMTGQIKYVLVLAVFCAVGCGERSARTTPERQDPVVGAGPHAFANVDDNLHHDTLLIQTTFDLGDGSFVMVASNVTETFEGLRLYRYRALSDNSVEMMAISSPAYDSWTMLPTFFPTDTTDHTKAFWVLANFGERESWGQKLLWSDSSFHDRGFLSIAYPERVLEDDTLRLKRRSIAPHVRVALQEDTSYFRFACDSVFVYADALNGRDSVVSGPSIHYTHHPETGLQLWLNGRIVPQQAPL